MSDLAPMAQPDVLDAAAGDETTDVERRGFALGTRLRQPRTLISFALALAIIGFILKGTNVNLHEIWTEMRHANPWLYGLAFVLFYATFPLRALRWRIILANAGFPVDQPAARRTWASLPALTEYLMLSWFANCVVPAKLGDAYRGYLLKHNGNVSFSRSVGTIVGERLLDMIVLFGLLVGSGWVVFGSRLPASARYIFVLGGVLVVAIVVFLAALRYLSAPIRRIMPERFKEVYGHFEEGTIRSLKPASLPVLLPLTIAVWLGESLRLFFVVQALGGLHLTLLSLIFVALTSSLLTTIPATPGGLGLVEGGIAGVLQSSLFAVGSAVAGAVVVLDRVINYWSIILVGLVVYFLSKRK